MKNNKTYNCKVFVLYVFQFSYFQIFFSKLIRLSIPEKEYLYGSFYNKKVICATIIIRKCTYPKCNGFMELIAHLKPISSKFQI